MLRKPLSAHMCETLQSKGLVAQDPFAASSPHTVMAYEKHSKRWVRAKVRERVEDGYNVEFCDGTVAEDEDKDGNVRVQRHHVLHMPSTPSLLDHGAADELAGALLREASAAGNVELVESLLESNVSLLEADAAANTALHCAAESGQLAVCEKLLKHGEKKLKLQDRQLLLEVDNAMQLRPCDLANSNELLRLLLPHDDARCLSLIHI